jgi:ABC-2 type transport system permease protein
MAVYEQRYKPFPGTLTPQWSRFLTIPRHAYSNIFKSKLFTGFYFVCFVPLLVAAILVYLRHNTSALALLQIPVRELLPINNEFFFFFVYFQGFLAFLATVFIGPRLVSRDVTDNAVALYLARPFSRAEYVLGKLSVLLILLSAITWVPMLLLFAFQAYLEGGTWLAQNGWMAWAIFATNAVWILMLALISQAISAWVKWATASRAALIAIYFIPLPFAGAINEMFNTHWGGLMSILFINHSLRSSLFRMTDETYIPVGAAWVMLFLFYGVSLWLLSRKVRAYEVIK